MKDAGATRQRNQNMLQNVLSVHERCLVLLSINIKKISLSFFQFHCETRFLYQIKPNGLLVSLTESSKPIYLGYTETDKQGILLDFCEDAIIFYHNWILGDNNALTPNVKC